MRKHHVEGMAALAAAEAAAAVARTPGASLHLVDGLAVVALGEATEAEIQDFADWAMGPDADRMIEEALSRHPKPKAKRTA